MFLLIVIGRRLSALDLAAKASQDRIVLEARDDLSLKVVSNGRRHERRTLPLRRRRLTLLTAPKI
jgi:hypothetical protein